MQTKPFTCSLDLALKAIEASLRSIYKYIWNLLTIQEVPLLR